MINILSEREKPNWVIYPNEYLEMVQNGRDEFLPWYLMDKPQLLIRYEGMQERYPDRFLFPFARDDNSDDVACWEKDKPGKVILIHDFASAGYENKMEFQSFNDWYFFVVNNYQE
jgi:hypothetical protein